MTAPTTWTREELAAECRRQVTIHELSAASDGARGQTGGQFFHGRRVAFWTALLAILDPQPAEPTT